MISSPAVVNAILSNSAEGAAKIRQLETKIRQCEQAHIQTEHVFHAGLYARTVRIAAGVVFTSALIKRATLLIVNGVCDVLIGSGGFRLEGHSVVPADAGRKTAYITRTDVEITMIFPTSAKTVAEAEAEFTDEAEILLSRTNDDDIVIVTGR